MKAHPSLGLTFHRIVVARRRQRQQSGVSSEGPDDGGPETGSGPPIVLVRGEDEGAPAQEALVSISHDGDYATAVCLGFESDTVASVG